MKNENGPCFRVRFNKIGLSKERPCGMTKRLLLIVVFLLAVCSLFSCSSEARAREGEISVHFLDVGQSDCAFIELFGKYTVLVDSSDAEHSDDVCEYIRKLGYERIDVMVISHVHSDHAGGAAAVMNEFAVGKVYLSEPEYPSDEYDAIISRASAGNVVISSVVCGDSFTFGEAECTFLSDPQKRFENENDRSTVMRLRYGKRAFLFMGDCESDAENALIKGSAEVRADVVKVGHHGSNNSSTADFIRKTGAEVAVISCSRDNEYGHPSPYVLDRWRSAGADVFVTGEHSTVKVTTDGNELFVSSADGSEPYASYSETSGKSKSKWILNTESHTIHKKNCVYAKKISDENKEYSSADIERLEAEGYVCCKNCFS